MSKVKYVLPCDSSSLHTIGMIKCDCFYNIYTGNRVRFTEITARADKSKIKKNYPSLVSPRYSWTPTVSALLGAGTEFIALCSSGNFLCPQDFPITYVRPTLRLSYLHKKLFKLRSIVGSPLSAQSCGQNIKFEEIMTAIENIGLIGLRLKDTALQEELAQLCHYIQAGIHYFIWLATSHACFSHFFGSGTDFSTLPHLAKCFKDYWEKE